MFPQMPQMSMSEAKEKLQVVKHHMQNALSLKMRLKAAVLEKAEVEAAMIQGEIDAMEPQLQMVEDQLKALESNIVLPTMNFQNDGGKLV